MRCTKCYTRIPVTLNEIERSQWDTTQLLLLRQPETVANCDIYDKEILSIITGKVFISSILKPSEAKLLYEANHTTANIKKAVGILIAITHHIRTLKWILNDAIKEWIKQTTF